MLDDWRSADVPTRTHAALQLLEVMTLRPTEIDRPWLKALRKQGLDSAALRATGAISVHFNLMNRLADACGFAVPDALQKARSARLLDFAGRHFAGAAQTLPWVRAEDGRLRPAAVEQARSRLLSAPGLTSTALRRQVDAYVRRAWGVPSLVTSELPVALGRYLDKLARCAYRITDEDIEALRQAGHGDEAIYEITLTGAVTAASIGIEELFAAMYD